MWDFLYEAYPVLGMHVQVPHLRRNRDGPIGEDIAGKRGRGNQAVGQSSSQWGQRHRASVWASEPLVALCPMPHCLIMYMRAPGNSTTHTSIWGTARKLTEKGWDAPDTAALNDSIPLSRRRVVTPFSCFASPRPVLALG